MLNCKTCAFTANATTSDTSHTCSRKHSNEYVTVDYMDWA
jgi:hypothetical protein